MSDDLDDLPERPRWRAVMDWVAPFALAVGLFLVIGWWRAPSLPEQAPPFAATSIHGEALSLDALRGRTVVLNFWATWCGPCRLEAPSLSAFADANPEIAVIGLAEDRDPRVVQRAAEQLGITFPVAVADRETLRAYGVTSYPTTVIIGPDGRVRTAHTGIVTRPQLAWMTR